MYDINFQNLKTIVLMFMVNKYVLACGVFFV